MTLQPSSNNPSNLFVKLILKSISVNIWLLIGGIILGIALINAAYNTGKFDKWEEVDQGIEKACLKNLKQECPDWLNKVILEDL